MKQQTLPSIEELFGPVIHAYTRKMAIDDGVLIDATDTAIEAGIKLPVAITQAVWAKYIAWDFVDNEKQTYQDQSGRLWDVIWMARCGLISARKGEKSETLFKLLCVPRDGRSIRAEETTLKIVIGPGDNAEPVLTIMLPNED